MTSTEWLKVIARYLLWAALILGSVWFIWHQGYERGEADVRIEVANQKTQQAADSLNQFIERAATAASSGLTREDDRTMSSSGVSGK